MVHRLTEAGIERRLMQQYEFVGGKKIRVLGFLNSAGVFSVLLRCGASLLSDGHLTFQDRVVVLSSGVQFFTDTPTIKAATIRLGRNAENQSPQWRSGGYKKNGDL